MKTLYEEMLDRRDAERRFWNRFANAMLGSVIAIIVIMVVSI